MRAGDAPALAALFAAAVRGAGPQHYTPEQVEAWAAAAATPGFPLATRNVTLVAEDPSGVVGFAALRPDGVDALYVHPDRMREGIGTMLLRCLLAEAEARGIDRLWTEASAFSRPVFERHGFAVAEVETVVRRGVRFERFRMVRG